MESNIHRLQRLGLTEYEAKAYLGLLNEHVSTATNLAQKSTVPRTKIYVVLEALANKGWVKIYSGVPLLFRAEHPRIVFTQIKKEYADFLESIQTVLDEEVNGVKERFVIMRYDMGLSALKDEIKKAKTVQISNATTDFLKRISESFGKDSVVKVLLYPGEKSISNGNMEYRQAEVSIVSLVKGKEVPSISVILDESRTFTAFQDPVDYRYVVNEMLYDECARCFEQWYNLGWNAAEEK